MSANLPDPDGNVSPVLGSQASVAQSGASRRLAIVVLGSGLLVIAVAQALAPVASPPLYDGVVVQEPYRYLDPPPGALGDPTSFNAAQPIDEGTRPLVAATSENPPQAQLIAPPGAFALARGTTSVTISIDAVPPVATPITGHIAGNVYRFVATDQTGAAVLPADKVTFVLRAPDGVAEATVARFTGDAWEGVATQPAGQPGIFVAQVAALGDLALIAPGPAPSGGSNPPDQGSGGPGVASVPLNSAPDGQGPFGLDLRILAVSVVAVAVSVVILWRFRRGTRPVPIAKSLGVAQQPKRPRQKRGRRRRG